MTTRASDIARDFELGDINEFPVIATDIIYEGSAVGDNASGYARPLVAGDPFRGFAESKVDNSLGAAGDKTVRVRSKGKVKLAITSLAITDVGKDVYASDDDTFTLTQSTNTRIGYVYRWLETGYGIIAFDANCGIQAELTDNSGGSASDTIADTPSSYVEATIANTIASIVAKVNFLLRKQGQ